MRWSAGWYGGPGPTRRPAEGRVMPGWDRTWTCGWGPEHVRSSDQGPSARLAVVGECGADDEQLDRALPVVRAHDWRSLTRWPGSYLTVARVGGAVAVIGDLAGQHLVYYRPFEGGVWWSTSATTLAALDGAPVDAVALAARLAFGQHDVLAERSLFRDVRRVPPGYVLLLTADGPRTERYEPAAYPAVDLPQAAPTVRAALTEAVATRLDERAVSADLAGLDSTTLACLAARRHGSVTAVTFADERLRDDDLSYAKRTVAAVPKLDHRVVPGSPETVYYAGLKDVSALPYSDGPNPYVVTASIKTAVLDAAARQSPWVHFTGAAGDALLSAPSSYIADLLREGHRGRALRHAHGHARLRHTSMLDVLGRARPAARVTLADAWRAIAAELRAAPRPWVAQSRRPVAWTPLLATADWMSRDVRGELAGSVVAAADALGGAPARLAEWADRQDVIRLGADVAGWRDMALAGHGVELAAPFLDNEVIRSCLSVPADERGAPGRYKALLAEAFGRTGEVPEFVLSRPTKGGFNAVLYAGLRTHRAALGELLGPSSRLAATGLVSTQPVAEMLSRAAAGLPTAAGALHLVVAAEVWMRQVQTGASQWWEEVSDCVAAA